MPAKETAEAILIIIRRILKWTALAAGGLVALGAAVWGAYEVYRHYDYEYPKSQVSVEIRRGTGECTKEYPYVLVVFNSSKRTIKGYSFYFDATEQGRSTNLADWRISSDDKIIKPKEGWGSCWKIRHRDSLPNQDKWIDEPNMEIRIKDFRPTFE